MRVKREKSSAFNTAVAVQLKTKHMTRVLELWATKELGLI